MNRIHPALLLVSVVLAAKRSRAVIKKIMIHGQILAAIGGMIAIAEQKRPVTPEDCVTVKYLLNGNNVVPSPLVISPDGKKVAYLLKAPNLLTNSNDIELYVKNLTGDSMGSSIRIANGDLSDLHWLLDSRHVTVLKQSNGKRVIESIDVIDGKHEVMISSDVNLVEYSMDGLGNIVVYAVELPRNDTSEIVRSKEIEEGYRIPFETKGAKIWSRRQLFITTRTRKGWTTPAPIVIQSPFSHESLRSLTTHGRLGVTVSPNGQKLLVHYLDQSENIPVDWRDNGYVKFLQHIGFVPGHEVLILYDLKRGVSSMPLETPFITSIPLWSSDSSSFTVFAKSPIGGTWEKEDSRYGDAANNHGSFAHLFWVDIDRNKVELVSRHTESSYPYRPPLFWSQDDSLLVGDLEGKIDRFQRQENRWILSSSTQLPLKGYGYIASNGKIVIGDTQSAAQPPELFLYDLETGKTKTLENLNPQFEALSLASVQDVNWRTSSGKTVSGFLFLPPDHLEGTAYPLVIQTKPYGGNWFACDQGAAHYPSFIPQPLANAKIAYLGFYYPDDHDGKQIEAFYPKGYPGGIAEAAFEADVYDTAVEELAKRGLVDKNRVGIIGFSRSGWYTEFALTHGRTKYKAATVADNASYSFSEYALSPLIGGNPGSQVAMYGGIPAGASLKSWLDYSISFNLDKIHTPLLMEQMGYGNLFNKRFAPPVFLSMPFEIYTGLNLLRKPVELYYYPLEEHQPDHPRARLANLQRNLDWYRFWLQGYERPSPEDPEQYTRWRKLRSLQEEGDHSAP